MSLYRKITFALMGLVSFILVLFNSCGTEFGAPASNSPETIQESSGGGTTVGNPAVIRTLVFTGYRGDTEVNICVSQADLNTEKTDLDSEEDDSDNDSRRSSKRRDWYDNDDRRDWDNDWRDRYSRDNHYSKSFASHSFYTQAFSRFDQSILGLSPTGTRFGTLSATSGYYNSAYLQLSDSCGTGYSVSVSNRNGNYSTSDSIGISFEGGRVLNDSQLEVELDIQDHIDSLARVRSDRDIRSRLEDTVGKF